VNSTTTARPARPLWRLVALASAVTLVSIGAASCGDDDDTVVTTPDLPSMNTAGTPQDSNSVSDSDTISSVATGEPEGSPPATATNYDATTP
jgi:hypothetical protein